MFLIEWLCEKFNPGPVGALEVHDNLRTRTRRSAILTGIPALFLVLLPCILVYSHWESDPGLLRALLICLGIEALYFHSAYWVNPEPDPQNMGWLGGLMNNPFRISDDYNRFLLFLLLVLLPGRLVAVGVVDFLQALRPGRKTMKNLVSPPPTPKKTRGIILKKRNGHRRSKPPGPDLRRLE